MTIGEKIKAIRTEKSLSQNEFGKLVGVSQRVVSYWERGQHRIPANTLIEISRTLAVDLSAFSDVETVEGKRD